jgi:hypothetical protein
MSLGDEIQEIRGEVRGYYTIVMLERTVDLKGCEVVVG